MVIQNLLTLEKQIKREKESLLEEQKSLKQELKELEKKLELENLVHGTSNLLPEIERKQRKIKNIELVQLPCLKRWESQLQIWQADKQLQTQYAELIEEINQLIDEEEKAKNQLCLISARRNFLEALGFAFPRGDASSYNHLQAQLIAEPNVWKKENSDIICVDPCKCSNYMEKVAEKYKELRLAITARFSTSHDPRGKRVQLAKLLEEATK